MRTLIILFVTSFYSLSTVQAQTLDRQIIGATGGTSSVDSGRLLMYNVGEPATATGVSGTFALTQGFEQGDSLKKDSLIGIIRYEIFSDINVYPNPGREIVFLKMESSRNSQLNILMYDLNGKEITRLKVELQGGQSQTEEITTTDLSFGTYFFHFIDSQSGMNHVVKWIHY